MRLRKLAILLAFLPCAAFGDTWLGGDVRLGYAGQTFELPFANPKWGLSPELGVTFELQHRHFLFTTGVAAAYSLHTLSVEDRQFDYTMLDTEGVQFIYNGLVADRRDISHTMSVNIPILFGAELRQHIYMLAGPRVKIALAGSTTQTANLATTGDYDRYYELLHDMPNHGFHSKQKTTTKNSLTRHTDVSLYGEIGGWWNIGRPTYGSAAVKFRLAVFAEYGLLNIKSDKYLGLLNDVDTSHYMDIKMNYALNSSEGMQAKLHSYTIGLRFAVLFRTSQNPVCNCEW